MFFCCVKLTDEELRELEVVVRIGKCVTLKQISRMLNYRVADGWEGMIRSDVLERAMVEALTTPKCGKALIPTLMKIAERYRMGRIVTQSKNQ